MLNEYWYHYERVVLPTQQEGPLRIPSEAGKKRQFHVPSDEAETTAPLDRAVTRSPEANESVKGA